MVIKKNLNERSGQHLCLWSQPSDVFILNKLEGPNLSSHLLIYLVLTLFNLVFAVVVYNRSAIKSVCRGHTPNKEWALGEMLSPPHVDGGEGEVDSLQPKNHEEPLGERTVPDTLSVIAGLTDEIITLDTRWSQMKNNKCQYLTVCLRFLLFCVVGLDTSTRIQTWIKWCRFLDKNIKMSTAHQNLAQSRQLKIITWQFKKWNEIINSCLFILTYFRFLLQNNNKKSTLITKMFCFSWVWYKNLQACWATIKFEEEKCSKLRISL